ncbi:alanine--tRNA ligase, mitochondrial [Cephus cinctus]|uniref:Alanine--tRNA ligase n=1 Tax=Cephus cinctus TaxID=211228 RepID=A0AAJ7FIL0_CEPCN|nr:alanine--tRNA ligase, mitochondrial [Cephus cinctus]XP_015593601.1 alanine--tRNA ligase, mitochondrial [Cephus cinctus]XP_015593603.1 alanine--tRNA ligase, mitochondrial [Cephus cinctus]
MFLRRLEKITKIEMIQLRNNIRTYKSAKAIRNEFLDYFTKDLGHTFVRSSPVLPLCDPTVAFVNAGMNQFKGVFLGSHEPPAQRVANSQKCIRVGGKHNDLDIVGFDTYHHTFFEMLGNWSFGDYFKKEACEYAWKLLTGPYGISKHSLYVTYFAGNEKLGLKPDLECKDIWLSLGVPEDRVLPFGMQDNFWEMGLTGPCGPCTEIHIDHTMQSTNQAARVNKGHPDVTELWNIVFIQYQRLANGPIVPLPKQHVDTGMGFERLVAVLQGKRSNYDTDLFQPLFEAIRNSTNAPAYQGRFLETDRDGVDSGYRILADHARMVTVALTDGILPEQNHKLRRILRKAIDVSNKTFKKNGLLRELTFHVANGLGDTYPELQKNLLKVQTIIEYEEELLNSLRNAADGEWTKIVNERPALANITDSITSGLAAGYKDLKASLAEESTTMKTIPGHLAFKLYDTYGLSADTIGELAKAESLIFDKADFIRELENARQRSKLGFTRASKDIVSLESLDLLEKRGVPKTEDSAKYDYNVSANGYEFSPVKSNLLGMIVNGNLISESESQTIDESQAIKEATIVSSGNVVEVDSMIDANSEVGIILDKTPFYAPEGGQLSDKGHIDLKKLRLEVAEVRKIRGYVIHLGKFIVQDPAKQELELRVGDECVATIDTKTRTSLMRHHTATHLLNAALRQILPVVCQRGSIVSRDSLIFQFSVYGEKFTPEHVATIEELVNKCIEADVAVKTRIVDSLKLSSENDLTLVPGEVYPDTNIRIMEVHSEHLISKEACCGTHVHKTGMIEHFCITSVKAEGSSSRTIKAAVGPLARLARLAAENVREKVSQLEKEYQKSATKSNILNAKIFDMNNRLKGKGDKILVPYLTVQECLARLNNLSQAIKLQRRKLTTNTLEDEMKSVIYSSDLPFVIHALEPTDTSLKNVSLRKITKLCKNAPVMVIAHKNGTVKARCCVPKDMASDTFNARAWMNTVLQVFKAEGAIVQHQDPLEAYNMKTIQVELNELKSLLEKAIMQATKFASLHVKQTKHKSK